MNVLDFIATADPIRTKPPIAMEFHELEFELWDGREIEGALAPSLTPTHRRIALVAAAVCLIAGVGVFIPRDSGPKSFDWAAPAISPAAATVNLSRQFVQQTRLNPGESLYAIHESSFFTPNGSLLDKQLTKSWTTTNLASVEYLKNIIQSGKRVVPSLQVWNEFSRVEGASESDLANYSQSLSPIWERTIPYKESQVMYRTLVQQSKVFSPSWISGSEWISYALHTLVTSETAAPAQRVMAIALSNALFERAITNEQWTKKLIAGRVMWSRTMTINSQIEVSIIDPEVPGLLTSVKYRIQASGQRVITYKHRIVSWAVVGDLEDEPTAATRRTVKTLDLSKL